MLNGFYIAKTTTYTDIYILKSVVVKAVVTTIVMGNREDKFLKQGIELSTDVTNILIIKLRFLRLLKVHIFSHY